MVLISIKAVYEKKERSYEIITIWNDCLYWCRKHKGGFEDYLILLPNLCTRC